MTVSCLHAQLPTDFCKFEKVSFSSFRSKHVEFKDTTEVLGDSTHYVGVIQRLSNVFCSLIHDFALLPNELTHPHPVWFPAPGGRVGA